MSAIDQRFQQLRAQGKRALLPFITAGDPQMALTVALLKRLDELECAMAEVGIPYSDPIADGPVIQASYHRALQNGFRLDGLFQALRDQYVARTMPLAGMVSFAMIHRRGMSQFVADAQQAGFSGVIVPDLLYEEGQKLSEICRRADFSLIQLVTPTTTAERAIRIAEQSTGFLYMVSVTGITGERRELPEALLDRVAWLRQRTSLPICVGFGISTAEQVSQVAQFADGVIVGSAIVRCVARSAELGESMCLERVGEFVQELQQGLVRG